MLAPSYPLYLANRPLTTDRKLTVTDKYTGAPATEVSLADAALVDRAIAKSVAAAAPMARLPAYARQEVLEHVVVRVRERRDELAAALCVEAGKPIRDARGEVTRLIDTLRVAAEESVRVYGEVMPLDISARAAAYRGMWKRVPIGPCALISPWNFPLNLVAHKIGPAIAAGCPFVLKPASATPIGALILGEILAETDLPEGAFSVLPCARQDAEALATDDRLKLLSFTGSPEVGWALKAKAGRKRVLLELGGNAACIVDQGWDLDDAVARIVIGAFYQSGQSCISVQRILAHEAIYDELRAKLVAATRALVHGDPKLEETFVGPIISEAEAQRIEIWVRSAEALGAKVLCGGGREGAMVEATLLEDVPPDEPLWSREVFGPVAALARFETFDQAIAEVNASRYGLQAGVFTRDLYKAQRAWDEIETGGVVIGDIPSWRVDHMPYGGVKHSGLGREGIRWSMEEMSEVRLLVIRTP